jgi:hypothetical protein
LDWRRQLLNRGVVCCSTGAASSSIGAFCCVGAATALQGKQSPELGLARWGQLYRRRFGSGRGGGLGSSRGRLSGDRVWRGSAAVEHGAASGVSSSECAQAISQSKRKNKKTAGAAASAKKGWGLGTLPIKRWLQFDYGCDCKAPAWPPTHRSQSTL